MTHYNHGKEQCADYIIAMNQFWVVADLIVNACTASSYFMTLWEHYDSKWSLINGYMHSESVSQPFAVLHIFSPKVERRIKPEGLWFVNLVLLWWQLLWQWNTVMSNSCMHSSFLHCCCVSYNYPIQVPYSIIVRAQDCILYKKI